MGIKVLLVDDARDFINYMSKRLVAAGIEVYVAYCGEDAIDIVKNKEVQIVVLDTLMPGLDGIETLKEISALNLKTKVIMLTGHSSVVEAVKALKLGAVDFLLKPCDARTLAKSIQHALAS